MADWHKLAKAFVLGDGHISQEEVARLRTAFMNDGHIFKRELNFLREIKKEAKSAVKMLDDLIDDCEKMAK